MALSPKRINEGLKKTISSNYPSNLFTNFYRCLKADSFTLTTIRYNTM